ncbi:MAG: hypothetical protein NVV70_13915 [Cellulomonas sp.]|nr:hypothetical protein [Cellulomonas sp.]MCR6649169.1 hypothetical protein [Cellulomonas sp.]
MQNEDPRQHDLDARVREHDDVRGSSDFRAQEQRLDRLTFAFVELVRHSWFQANRHTPIIDGLLMYAATDDTLESVIAIRGLVAQGVHNMVRRECRYLLESATKYLYVDQQLPNVREVTRQQRIAYLKQRVPRSSIEPIQGVHVVLGDGHSEVDFRNDVKDAWSKLAGYVHPSATQVEERLQRASRGAYVGFEDVKAVRRLVDEIARSYDMLGVMWLMAAGPSAAGEILTDVEGSNWAFAKSRWLPAMSRYYDYKAERGRGQP